MPHLNEFVETFEGEDFVVMMISTEESDLLADFAEDYDAQMWVVRDADGDMFEGYGVEGIPNSVVIDKDGKIAYQGHPSQVQEEDIQELLDAE